MGSTAEAGRPALTSRALVPWDAVAGEVTRTSFAVVAAPDGCGFEARTGGDDPPFAANYRVDLVK